MKRKIVIIGGGFGGINAAKKLDSDEFDITLIDKNNHHLFQPLLYQVATAALSPADIAEPIRSVFKKQKNIKVIMAEVQSIDRNNRTVNLDGEKVEFDYLIVAIGSKHSYFGNDHWEKFAPGLKTLNDALTIREQILISLEKAERTSDLDERNKYMTFVVVGGGPTGVEMAGAIAEITKQTMIKDFRNIDPSKTNVILIEGMEKILGTYDEPLNNKAKKALEDLGVDVRTGEMVSMIDEYGVSTNKGKIKTENVIWAAGNSISPMLKSLNTEYDKAGRVIVENDCSIKGDENIFVIGDAALFIENEKSLPGIAPVAMQQGRYVGKIIFNQLSKEKREPFKYFDKGNLATIGRAKAVMQIGKIKLSGFFAWLIWGLVHIAFLISFRKRYKVMVEWIWYYISNRHGIRLITNKPKK
ncbi:MAG: NAD(P)/FAD-dependent oxidoreductase [Melioribacteraceae bacterium]|nr:NAD(P)/FAD-dependent oxidoreductase [Melioribacteraceae bacterium]MCF8394660.1 NAD(P)/FAD-dependent oxidoreductase [Melioribacteraceae bacterium]MCF8418006.1 NAD(P)/FAD-dependent oxidoreductase [Melioribacteraceae bacterium]